MKPIGVQLYSLREKVGYDFVSVLKRVAEIGYKYVEPAGLWNVRPSEFKKVLDDLGLKMVSSHTPWARDPHVLGEVMETAHTLGLNKIVCGYWVTDFESMDAIKRTAENTNKMQEILAANGFTLFQHNHDFEFQRLDGRIKYEIYKELCPNLKYQIDCFWSTNRGTENPVDMLKIFADDTISMHMKDGFVKQNVSGDKMVNGILDRKVELMPLGQGDLPIKDLVANAPASAEAIIVELDYCNVEMWQAIEESYKFMTGNGLAEGNK
ncbi:MAG: sugar phosphate isomerase/epimerase [Lentisphaeria bacterium]|nr:sugar phosphate isomerase/epimerase [Lentisphaerota bacterium]MBQ9772533.1 sugar phosphate isomerase/epimerase [Lentisphaeria bacterium]